MAFTLEFSEESVVQMQRMEKIVVKRIIKKLDSTLPTPHSFFKRLEGRPEYKLRVGDYRIIANIDEKSHVVVIRSIGHRRDIYKRH